MGGGGSRRQEVKRTSFASRLNCAKKKSIPDSIKGQQRLGNRKPKVRLSLEFVKRTKENRQTDRLAFTRKSLESGHGPRVPENFPKRST